MNESYVEAFGALAGSLVDETAAFALEFAQGVGNTVFHCEGYMLDAAAAAVVGDELGDGAVFGGAFQKLNLGLTDLEERGAYFLVGYFFDGEALEAEHVLVEGDCLVERRNGNADVFDMGNFHNK